MSTPAQRITYYRGMIITRETKESYRVIINGIKSAVALTGIEAAQTLIDTHLKNKEK